MEGWWWTLDGHLDGRYVRGTTTEYASRYAKRPKGRQRIESPQAVGRTGEMGGDSRRSRSGMVRYTGLSEGNSRRCMGGVQSANYRRNMMEKRGKPRCQ